MPKLLFASVALLAQTVLCAQLVNLNESLTCNDKDCEPAGLVAQEATVRQDGHVDRLLAESDPTSSIVGFLFCCCCWPVLGCIVCSIFQSLCCLVFAYGSFIFVSIGLIALMASAPTVLGFVLLVGGIVWGCIGEQRKRKAAAEAEAANAATA